MASSTRRAAASDRRGKTWWRWKPIQGGASDASIEYHGRELLRGGGGNRGASFRKSKELRACGGRSTVSTAHGHAAAAAHGRARRRPSQSWFPIKLVWDTRPFNAESARTRLSSSKGSLLVAMRQRDRGFRSSTAPKPLEPSITAEFR